MSVNIEVSGGFKITTDAHNWIVNRKQTVDPTKAPNWEKRKAEGASPDKYTKWVESSYHPSLDAALNKIADIRMKESDASSFTQLRDEIAQFRREISAITTEAGA